MANRDVVITISARDNFSAVMNKYKTAVKQAGDQTDKMKTSNKSMKDSFTEISNVVQGVFGAAVLQNFVQTVGHLNEIGIKANVVEETFKNVSKSVGGYEKTLAGLRQVTGGVVDDLTLMNSANKLILTGSAQTTEQLEKMTMGAVKLGAAFGRDAASSLEDWTLLMANKSKLRLDQFGISADAVTQRINKLKDEGFGDEDAWNIAVFAEMDEALLKIGDSAKVSESAFNRLRTKMENARNEAGELTAELTETASQLALIALMGSEDPEIRRQFEQQLAESMGQGNADLMGRTGELLAGPLKPVMDYNTWAISEIQRLIGGTPSQPNAASSASAFGGTTNTGTYSIDMAATQSNLAAQEAQTRARGMVSQFVDRASVGTQSFNQGKGNLGLMSPESIITVLSVAEDLEIMFENIEDNELIDPMEVDMLESMRDSASDMADEAERAQKAFENMSLSEMFGQSNGGRLGELGDMVLGNIEDEDQRAAVQSALDMASGRETDLSVAFEEKFAPLLGDVFDQFGEEIGIQATQAALNALEQGQLEGKSTEEIMAMVQAGIGYNYSGGGGGTSFEVKPGDTPWGISQQTGLSYEDIYSVAGGGGNQFIYPGSYSVGGGGELVSMGIPPEMDELQESMDTLQESKDTFNETPLQADTEVFRSHIESLEDYLVTLSNTPVQVDVTLKVDDSELVAVGWSPIKGGSGSSVRRNGGSVAGEDPRTPQKPWS